MIQAKTASDHQIGEGHRRARVSHKIDSGTYADGVPVVAGLQARCYNIPWIQVF